MSVKVGRRTTDVDLDVDATEQWMNVLRRARIALLAEVTGGVVPDKTTVELRFDAEVEKHLRDGLGKIALRQTSIREVIDQLQEAGRVQVAHISEGGMLREVRRLNPPK